MSSSFTPEYDYGVEFQFQILCAMAKDPRFVVDNFDCLNAAYFTKNSHVVLSNLILDYSQKHNTIPSSATLEELLRDYFVRMKHPDHLRREFENECNRINSTDVSDLDYLRDQVVNFGKFQAYRIALSQGIDIAQNNNVEDLERVRQIFDEALKVGASSTNKGMKLSDHMLNLGDLAQNDSLYSPESKCPTGFDIIDQCLGGGIAPSELCIVLAATKTGKSTMLINFARAALARNLKVVYYTFELKEFDVLMRMAASMTGCTLGEISNNTDIYKERASAHAATCPYFRVHYFPPGRISADNIRSHLHRIRSEDDINIGALYIDYPDLMRKSVGDDDYRTMGEIYQQLIGIGHDFECPIFGASQTNRSAVNARDTVDMSMVGDSFKKMTDADVIISVNRTPEEKENNLLKLNIIGARRGEDNVTVFCRVDYARMLVREIPTETYDEVMRGQPMLSVVGEED